MGITYLQNAGLWQTGQWPVRETGGRWKGWGPSFPQAAVASSKFVPTMSHAFQSGQLCLFTDSGALYCKVPSETHGARTLVHA